MSARRSESQAWKYAFILNTFVASVTYFAGLPAVWSGENPISFFARSAWVMSAYAVGESAGYLISEQIYLQKRAHTKTTILLAIGFEIFAAVLFFLAFSKTDT